MAHEIISVPDQTPGGNGRQVIWKALGLLIRDRCERIRIERCLHQTEASLRHQAEYGRDIDDAAVLMRALRPESAGEVRHLLGDYARLAEAGGAREPAPDTLPARRGGAADTPPGSRHEKRSTGPKRPADRRSSRAVRP